MRASTRTRVVLCALGVTLAALALAFTFGSRSAASDGGMIDLAERNHIGAAAVRAAFANAGLPLRHSYEFALGVVLSDTPPARHGRGTPVLVTVAGPAARVDFGPVATRYDARFENVLVTYDGADASVIERLDAAVAALDR
jgi:alcohol dehydrogenase class IV